MAMLDVIILFVLGVAAIYWLSAARCKEIAVRFARAECRRHDVQLLDQTVYQVWLSLHRDEEDRWRVWRRFKFDYSIDGATRESGELIMLGLRVVHIRLGFVSESIH